MNAYPYQTPQYPVTPPAYGGVPNYGAAGAAQVPPVMANPYDPYYAQVVRLQQMTAQQQAAVNPPAPAQPPVPQVSVVGVDNEQQALDAPADLTGTPQLFTMRDDSAIFAKRFNVKNAKVEFTKYSRESNGAAVQGMETAEPVNSIMTDVIKSFTTQLNKIEKDLTDVKESIKNVQFSRNSQPVSAVQPATQNRVVASPADGGAGARSVADYGNA
jgi:hypothetical protein